LGPPTWKKQSFTIACELIDDWTTTKPNHGIVGKHDIQTLEDKRNKKIQSLHNVKFLLNYIQIW
jgi:hypothetical protein